MYTYKDLQSLLDISVKWEKDLKDLYEVAELGIKNKKSKELVQFLLAKQTSMHEILTNIDVNNFGHDEFIMYTPEDHTEDLIPQHDINSQTEPDEIIGMIRDYEAKLKGYYKDIADHLISDSQKELFISLVTLKDAQLEAIDNYMRNHFKPVV